MELAPRKGADNCMAKNCKNHRRRCKISYFSFPKEKERCRKWVMQCGREDLLEKVDYLHRGYKLCAIHFEEKMFLNDLRNRLHAHAIPTIFPIYTSSPMEVVDEHNYSSRTPPETCVTSNIPRVPRTILPMTNKAPMVTLFCMVPPRIQEEKPLQIIQPENYEIANRAKGHLNVEEKLQILESLTDISAKFPNMPNNKQVKIVKDITGFANSTIYRVLKEFKETHSFRPPKKSKRTASIIVDERVNHLIRRAFHSFFFREELPTVDNILQIISTNEEIPKMSKSTLYNLLKKLHLRSS